MELNVQEQCVKVKHWKGLAAPIFTTVALSERSYCRVVSLVMSRVHAGVYPNASFRVGTFDARFIWSSIIVPVVMVTFLDGMGTTLGQVRRGDCDYQSFLS